MPVPFIPFAVCLITDVESNRLLANWHSAAWAMYIVHYTCLFSFDVKKANTPLLHNVCPILGLQDKAIFQYCISSYNFLLTHLINLLQLLYRCSSSSRHSLFTLLQSWIVYTPTWLRQPIPDFSSVQQEMGSLHRPVQCSVLPRNPIPASHRLQA